MNIKEALQQKLWAVVGATDRKEKFGYKIFHRLCDEGYRVYPIHPVKKEIDGVLCYRSLEELPEVPQVVVFVVGETVGLKTVQACLKKGAATIWLQPGADSPTVVKAAEQAGIRVIRDCVLVQLDKNKK